MLNKTLGAILLSTGLVSAEEKKCRALALSGGGAFGSYEIGVMWGMYHNAEDKGEYAYDVMTGVSAGALNTLGISMFSPGDEENMLNFMSDYWAKIGGRDVY